MKGCELRRIIADDFTGACDAGGGLASLGRPAWVFTSSARRPLDPDAVVVVDIDARDSDKAAACERARETASWLIGAVGREPLMMKVDSTLRGPIAAMLDGVLSSTGRTRLFVAPAFPEHGRTVLEGRVQWPGGPNDGIPVADAIHRGVQPRLVGLSELRGGDPSPFVGEGRRGSSVTVVDGITPEDMGLAARLWCDAGADAILVGSAGIARAIARLRDRHPGPAPSPTPRSLAHGDGLVVVAGSAAAATRRQLAELEAFDWTNAEEAGAGPRLRGLVCFAASPAYSETLDGGQEAARVAAAAAAWASSHDPPRAAVVAGGRTGRALMNLLDVEAVRVDGELEPGVPTGRIVGGPWNGVPIVTKAGNFGDDGLLTRIVAHLGMKRGSEDPGRNVGHGW